MKCYVVLVVFLGLFVVDSAEAGRSGSLFTAGRGCRLFQLRNRKRCSCVEKVIKKEPEVEIIPPPPAKASPAPKKAPPKETLSVASAKPEKAREAKEKPSVGLLVPKSPAIKLIVRPKNTKSVPFTIIKRPPKIIEPKI